MLKLQSLFFFAILVVATLVRLSTQAAAQTTAFSYQGKLTDAGQPANGNFDLQFKLYDALNVGTQQGNTLTNPTVAVSNGVFTVTLDFGANVFSGAGRWLEIGVRPAGSVNAYTVLAPRQPVTSTPYAIQTLRAASADTLSNVCAGCVQDAQINAVAGSKLTGTIPVAAMPPGSANYIQNTTTQQASSNFNISGNGTAGGTLSSNIVNATTQYNLGGSRVLNSPGTNNLFIGLNAAATGPTGIDNTYVGNNAGNASTTGDANSFFGVSVGYNNQGSSNSFFGRSAGFSNTIGSSNSFFGVQAGRDNCGPGSGCSNVEGSDNSFFGRSAGQSNTIGFYNSFFGRSAGQSNQGGAFNSFFGRRAGYLNTMGEANSFFGDEAGNNNTIGGNNSFFGAAAGYSNEVGSFNSFFGQNAGNQNLTGNNNTVIGSFANVGSGNLSYATAIGAEAIVTASNRVQIGRSTLDTVAIGAFASPSSSTPVCINGQGVFTGCASSSRRYKESVQPLRLGLSLIQRLRPVTFRWKEDHQPDLGLIAEEVAAVEPALNTYNHKGEIEGVKYQQLTVVLINAVKEQQAQIEKQQAQLKRQQQQLDALCKLVCQTQPQAAVCQE